MITIKDTLGNIRFSTEINTGSRRKFSLMSEDYIVLKFSVEDPVYFKLGDYTDTELGLFELVDLYKPTLNDSTGAYDYELRLDAYYYKWKNKIFKFNPEVGGSEAGWKLTATLDVHLGVFLRNLSALGYTYKGTPFEVNIDSTVAKTSKLIVYDNTNLIDALTQMAETWECEWWVEDNQIRFGRCEFGDPVDFVINENVERMTREESKATFATRVYAFGSTRNIPNDYRPVDESVVVNGIVQKRLMMPTGVPYVDAYPDMTTEEAVEDVVIFDYIYPRRTGTMSSVTPVERPENVENEDGSTTQQKYTVYQFKDTGITFSKDYILPGEELRIVFQTGAMAGMDFAVTFNPDNLPEKLEDGSWNPQAQLWEIVRNEDYGRMLPADTLIPANGDTYNLYGFDSTSTVFEDMIKRAEEELEEKAKEYVEKTKIDPNTYPCTMMSDYMYNDGNVRTNEFTVGAKINLINPAYFENGRVSRVIGFEFDLDIPYSSPTFTIGETASYSRIGEIEDKVDELTYKGQVFTGTGSGVYVIGTNDNTPPTNKNVYSALKVLREFVRYQGWVDQPVRQSDPVKFNSVTSTDFESKLKGWIIDALGNAEFRDVLLRSFKSWNFAAGPLGAGVGMVNDDELQTDKLLVRKIMYVLEMMIQRMRFQGGIMVLSPATGFKIDRVETFDTYYRVYCRPEDFNEFEVNDQARIQNFTGNNIKYLWSLVLSRGDDYIDISRVDKDGDGVPAEGDEIVQLGNRTNPDRQDAVLLSAVNGEVGIFTYYGINSFDLSSKEGSWLGKHGGKKGAVIRGEVHITAGSSGLEQFDEYEDVDKRIQDAKDLADSVQDVVNNLTSIIIPDMQGQIDGSIMSHEGKVPPTLTNEPAVNWTTEEEKNRHIGDYYDYYLTVDGEQVTERYKFSKVNGTYQWVRVADSGSALAASVAREALGLAGTKATITWGNTLPEAPYNINDMWIKLDGSMYICNHQRLDGETGSQSDWQLFNDTMLRLAKMADDNVITKEEKATLRDTWNQIQKEFTAYQAQATKYGVSITALQNAYNTLNTFLTNTVKLSRDDEDTNLSVAQKTEYNQDFANYYSERTAFANVIAQKVADESVGNLQIGMGNLLKGSNVELNRQQYCLGTYFYDTIPEVGKTYTIVMCYTLGENNTHINVFQDYGSNYAANFNTRGNRVIESKSFKFTIENTIYMGFVQFPNGTYGSKVHWAVLVEGNKGPNSWIPSQADNDAKAQAIAKAEAELAETKANAYADGIVTEAEQNAINEAEAKAIASNINVLNAEKADVDAYYNKLHANAYLAGTAKTNLASAKTAYNTAHTNLINSINTAIADGKTTATEKADVDAKFTAYNTALSTYQTRVGEADKAIQDQIKALAEQDATNKVNGIQIGVRNLLLNSGVEVKNSSYNTKVYSTSLDILPNKKYTVVIRGTTTGGQRLGAWFNSGNNMGGLFPVNMNDEVSFIHIVSPASIIASYKRRLHFFNYPESGVSTNPATIKWACLYEGHVKPPLDWVQAPEDITDRLDQWASDGYISPQEKTALRQQKSDIQAEYNDIVTNANRYNISLTSYSAAYNSAISALNKYTATSPENIAVSSDYNNIAAYYPARQTILNSIAAAAKAQADKATWAIGMDGGKMLYADPEFKKGLNGTTIYGAQNGGGTVVISRTKKSTGQNQAGSLTSTEAAQIKEKLAGSPHSESDWCLYIRAYGGTTTSHLGGFYFCNKSRANAVFIVKVSAKIPVGYTLKNAHNSHGTGYKQEFLTPMVGTGKYETYIFKETCGSTGTFSTMNHLYLSGPVTTGAAPCEWFVDYATVFDMTADGYGDIEYNAKDDLAQQLGYSDFDEMVTAAKKGDTLIDGGYINTQLIDVETLVADTALVDKLSTNILKAGSITANMISVGGFEFQNGQIYGGSDFGTGPGVKITSKDEERSFKAYKDENNYISLFYNNDSDWGLIGKVDGSELLKLGKSSEIGGFSLANGRIGTISSINNPTKGMSLYDSFIKFKDDDVLATIGVNTIPSSTGFGVVAARFEVSTVWASSAPQCNVALKLDSTGHPNTYTDAGRNYAIYAYNGLIVSRDAIIDYRYYELSNSGPIRIDRGKIVMLNLSSLTNVYLPTLAHIRKVLFLDSSAPQAFMIKISIFTYNAPARLYPSGRCTLYNENGSAITYLSLETGDAVDIVLWSGGGNFVANIAGRAY